MKKIIINSLIKILKIIKGQDTWESLYKLALKQMNYGNGGDFDKSGELNVIKYINEKLFNETKIIIFDVGGNNGDYATELASFFSTKAIIHSFEPSSSAFHALVEKTKNINNLISNNFGLSDFEENLLLYTNIEGSVWASVYQRDLERYGISLDKSELIKLTTIDNYCEENKIDRINFLKLDIEGHELKALNGAKQMINNKKIDFIQFEFSSANIDSRTYFHDFYLLLKNNYQLYRITQNNLFDLKEYQETYEVFTTTNYLAVKKSNN